MAHPERLHIANAQRIFWALDYQASTSSIRIYTDLLQRAVFLGRSVLAYPEHW